MALFKHDAGVWKEVSQPYVHDGGAWKALTEGYVHDSGAWKLYFGGYSHPNLIYEFLFDDIVNNNENYCTLTGLRLTSTLQSPSLIDGVYNKDHAWLLPNGTNNLQTDYNSVNRTYTYSFWIDFSLIGKSFSMLKWYTYDAGNYYYLWEVIWPDTFKLTIVNMSTESGTVYVGDLGYYTGFTHVVITMSSTKHEIFFNNYSVAEIGNFGNEMDGCERIVFPVDSDFSIDSLRVFDVQLRDNEIQELYELG